MKNPTFEEIKTITNKLPKKGLRTITLSGGEPTLRKDLPKICEYISKKRIKPCIITSGCNEDLLLKLKPHISKMIVSFRASYPFLDNRMKGKSYAFDKAFNTIRLCTKLRINRSIHMTINKLNLHDLENVITFSKHNDAELTIIRFIPFTKEDKKYDLSPKEVDETYETIIKRGISKGADLHMFCREKKENFFCPAGITRICITTYGDVMPCPLVNFRLGNLLEEDLNTILKRAERWREKWLEEEFKDVNFYKKYTHCIGYAMSCMKK